MNTNDNGLNGLAYADEATKRRIVLLLYKKNDLTPEQWKAEKNIVKDPSFAFSLYYYMYHEYRISADYDPDGFNDDFGAWKALNEKPKRTRIRVRKVVEAEDEN